MVDSIRKSLGFSLNRTISVTSPTLESGHEGFGYGSEQRRRILGDSSSVNARGRQAGQDPYTTDSSETSATARPPLATSKSYNNGSHATTIQSSTSRSNSRGASSNETESTMRSPYKKAAGGSFAQNRGFAHSPPALNLNLNNNNYTGPPRLNTARLQPATPLWPGTAIPGTPGAFPPASFATVSVAKRAFRSRASLFFSIGLFMFVISTYFRTFHPEASGALYNSAKAPLASAANAAKAVIKGGGSTGADMRGESWGDLLGFSGDLLDINSWGLLNSGRDRDGLLPLSPWNRYKEKWSKHREDALLRKVDENKRDGVSHDACDIYFSYCTRC
jgi:hypothetical protein